MVDPSDEIILDFFKQPKTANLKFFIMMIISQSPTHGYELIKKIEEKTSKQWKPSHGAIYKTLKELEEKDYVKAISNGEHHRNQYELTSKGAYLVRRFLYEFQSSLKVYFQITLENADLDVMRPLIKNIIGEALNYELLDDYPADRRKSILKTLREEFQFRLDELDEELRKINEK